MHDKKDAVPTPGHDAAPDAPSDPESDVTVDGDSGTLTRSEESGVGPGAGESPVVRVSVPLQREKGETTRHPTLRDDDVAGEPAAPPETSEMRDDAQRDR